MEEAKEFKKRRRLARPKPLVLFGVLFLFLPLINYFIISYQMQIPFTYPKLLLSGLRPMQLGLLFAPIIVGIGLLSVEKWGYFVFLVYSGILILHNLVVVLQNPVLYNLGAVAQTLFGTTAILYFIRKDISAPYMKMYPRGWRLEKRKPIGIEIAIFEKKMKTRDVSVTGFYVDWTDCPYNINDDVLVIFEIAKEKFRLEAGIVRIDDEGVGIALRDMDAETEKRLENSVNSLNS